jgi:hypothetical protein
MSHTPYRHSVWIDVFGLVLVGTVVLGGVGYLLYHTGHVAHQRLHVAVDSRESSGSVRPPARTRRPQASSAARAPRATPRGSRPLTANPPPSIVEARGSRAGTETPFSEAWRAEVLGPRAALSDAPRSAPAGPGAFSESPSLGRLGTGASGSTDGPTGDAGPSASGPVGAQWRAEAQRLGRTARALSGQLGRMDRKRGPGATAGSESEGGRNASARRSGGTVPEPPPPSVPIDDHLHWLLVAGVLWGAWRMWRGG